MIGSTRAARAPFFSLPVARASAGFNMSLWFFFVTLGNIAGPIVGTYVASSYGYDYAFFTSMDTVWVAIVFFLAIYLRDRSHRAPATGTNRPLFKGFTTFLRIPTIHKMCLLTLLGFLGCNIVSSFLSIYATERVGMTAIAISSMATFGVAGRQVASPTIGRISDKINKRKLLLAILAISYVRFALYPFATDAIQLTLLTRVSMCFSFSVLSISMHSTAAPKELSGISPGLYGTFEDLGLMFDSLIFVFSWGEFGPSSVFIISSAASRLAAILAITLPEQKQ